MGFLILFLVILFVVCFVEGIFALCFLTDKDFMGYLGVVKKDYGIILNPRRMGAIIHHYRWPKIDWSWHSGDTFWLGIPATICQFITKPRESYSIKDKYVEPEGHANIVQEYLKK